MWTYNKLNGTRNNLFSRYLHRHTLKKYDIDKISLVTNFKKFDSILFLNQLINQLYNSNRSLGNFFFHVNWNSYTDDNFFPEKCLEK